MCADPSSANTQEGPSTDLWSSFCMQLSALWCTVLWILGTLFCLHPQFCLLNAQRSLFLTGFCCLKWSLETFWDNSSVHVHCFPSLRDQWSWLTYVKKRPSCYFIVERVNSVPPRVQVMFSFKELGKPYLKKILGYMEP